MVRSARVELPKGIQHAKNVVEYEVFTTSKGIVQACVSFNCVDDKEAAVVKKIWTPVYEAASGKVLSSDEWSHVAISILVKESKGCNVDRGVKCNAEIKIYFNGQCVSRSSIEIKLPAFVGSDKHTTSMGTLHIGSHGVFSKPFEGVCLW